MNKKIIIAGSGGQGVQFIGKFLASYGIKMNHQVTYIPSYGAEMRGGSTDAQVVINDTEVSMPLVKDADALLLLSPLGMMKYPGRIKKDCIIFYNSGLIKLEELEKLYGTGYKIKALNVEQIASDFGIKTLVNVPFIYFLLKEIDYYNKEILFLTLESMLKEKQKILQTNKEYIEFLEKLPITV